MSESLDGDTVEKLIDGRLPWEELRADILPDPKDPGRFEAVREVLQECVEWDEQILVPLNDHLFVVGSDEGRIVKSECGHEFCAADENWKTACRVRVREGTEDMSELYPPAQTPDPDWTFQLREFFCPECYTLVDVDAVPAGYPVLEPFDPDIDAFYREWLGEEPPDAGAGAD